MSAGAGASVLEIPKGEVRHTLGREHPPVAVVAPGTRLRIETELNIGDVLRTKEERFEPGMLKLPFVNPVTGPIAVEGATPASVLVCRLEEMELVPPGFTALVPGFGPFVDWIRRRDFGVHSRVVDVQDGEVLWDDRTRIPVSPMVGTIGTAPLLESISTIDNGPHGGNMDVQEIGPGATLYLPIAVDGGLFFLGDCHAVQGDGELCGIGAIEIRTRTTVTLVLRPRPEAMGWPRLETDEHIAAIASARPLEDAFRIAVEELVGWMVADYGFTAPDAVLLLGQVAEARCTQLVNPKYTYIAKIAKRYLG
jgi:acetamidase/formamidase